MASHSVPLPKAKRGILKTSARTPIEESTSTSGTGRKEFHFDEENIKATYHPADKDYGHMKIDEPNTPYQYYSDDEGRHAPALHAESLTERLEQQAGSLPRAIHRHASFSEEDEDEEEEQLSPAEQKKHEQFVEKRRKHYNEFLAVQMMRQRMTEQGDEEDEDEDMPPS